MSAPKDIAGMFVGKAFSASFRNVNIKAVSVKGGWRYKFEAEMTEEDFEEFRGADLTGSLFEAQLECVEVAQAKPEQKPKPRAEKKGAPLAELAGQWCRDGRFFDFIAASTYYDVDFASDTEEQCHGFILETCQINSRRDLDTDERAAQVFHERVREPFMRFLGEHNG